MNGNLENWNNLCDVVTPSRSEEKEKEQESKRRRKRMKPQSSLPLTCFFYVYHRLKNHLIIIFFTFGNRLFDDFAWNKRNKCHNSFLINVQ